MYFSEIYIKRYKFIPNFWNFIAKVHNACTFGWQEIAGYTIPWPASELTL